MTSLHARLVKSSYFNRDFVLSKTVKKCKDKFIFYNKILIFSYYRYSYPDWAPRNPFRIGPRNTS